MGKVAAEVCLTPVSAEEFAGLSREALLRRFLDVGAEALCWVKTDQDRGDTYTGYHYVLASGYDRILVLSPPAGPINASRAPRGRAIEYRRGPASSWLPASGVQGSRNGVLAAGAYAAASPRSLVLAQQLLVRDEAKLCRERFERAERELRAAELSEVVWSHDRDDERAVAQELAPRFEGSAEEFRRFLRHGLGEPGEQP